MWFDCSSIYSSVLWLNILCQRLGTALETQKQECTLSRTSLEIQWLRSCISNAGSIDVTPSWGTSIPHAAWPKNKNNKNKRNTSLILTEAMMPYLTGVYVRRDTVQWNACITDTWSRSIWRVWWEGLGKFTEEITVHVA